MEVLLISPKKVEYLLGSDGEPLNPRSTYFPLTGNKVNVPIEVFERDDTYYVLSGHRRLHWALSKRFKTIPVIVVPEPETEADKLCVIMRGNNYKPFTPMEKARSIRKLALLGKSWAEIVRASGIPKRVALLLSDLNDAPPAIQKAVDDNRLSLSAWDKIRKENAARQEAILAKAEKAAKHGKATVTAVRKARKAIAAEDNGAPMVGDPTIIERWNTVKQEIETLMGIGVPIGDAQRVHYVMHQISDSLKGD